MAVGVLFGLHYEGVEVSVWAGAEGISQAVGKIGKWLFFCLNTGCLKVGAGSGREFDPQAQRALDGDLPVAKGSIRKDF